MANGQAVCHAIFDHTVMVVPEIKMTKNQLILSPSYAGTYARRSANDCIFFEPLPSGNKPRTKCRADDTRLDMLCWVH